MTRHKRLRKIENVMDVADAKFAGCKNIQDSYASRVSESLEQFIDLGKGA